MIRQPSSPVRPRRRGAVLILVLFLAPALALGAYSFTHWMRAEAQAANMAVQRVQCRLLAESGVDYVRAVMAASSELNPSAAGLTDNPGMFAGHAVSLGANIPSGYFSVLGGSPDGFTLRYGVRPEGGKFPLNVKSLQPDAANLALVPGMDEALADSLLDWLDSDSTPRYNGLESVDYESLDPPVRARNGVPRTMGELLRVRGMSPFLIFGPDRNGDGLIGANEGSPEDPPGLNKYLSIYSQFSNLSPTTLQNRINLNDSDTTTLQSRISEIFGSQFAQFAIAMKAQGQLKSISSLIDAQVGSNSSAGPNRSSSLTSGGNSSGQGNSGQGSGRSQGGSGQSSGAMKSPWSVGNAASYLEQALLELTVSADPTLTGRVDISTAPAEVLALLPGVGTALAEKVAGAAANRTSVDPTPAWLLTENVVTLAEFQTLEPLIWCGSQVVSFEAVGYFETGGPIVRLATVVDASSMPPKVVELIDKTSLGSDYTREMLLGRAVAPPK